MVFLNLCLGVRIFKSCPHPSCGWCDARQKCLRLSVNGMNHGVHLVDYGPIFLDGDKIK